MHITVILCTYNRCGLLPMALESVAASAMPAAMEWEVLVVDNNSPDRTREVVESFVARYPGKFRYLFEKNPGKSHALNAGIASAKGSVLAFMDDDVTVAPDWLQKVTEPLREKGYAGSGGRVFPQWTAPPPRWIAKEGWAVAGPLVSFDRGPEGFALKESPVGTNMAFQKSIFVRCGGFRTDLGPSPNNEIRNEDSEFARRVFASGAGIYYEPSAIVYHHIPPERLQKKYFLQWWFDKGRSEIREWGAPSGAGWTIAGVPPLFLRRLAKWTAQWAFTFNPRFRFECKLKAWLNAGMIRECYAGSRAKLLTLGTTPPGTSVSGASGKSGIEAREKSYKTVSLSD
jgi:glycosyltransferase involved in cell wall biosynthesis